jgi:hypothetical protein
MTAFSMSYFLTSPEAAKGNAQAIANARKTAECLFMVPPNSMHNDTERET